MKNIVNHLIPVSHLKPIVPLTFGRYSSHALWPKECYTGDNGSDNISNDKHETLECAIGVCDGLWRVGFGGEGKYLPLAVWVTNDETGEVVYGKKPMKNSYNSYDEFVKDYFPNRVRQERENREKQKILIVLPRPSL